VIEGDRRFPTGFAWGAATSAYQIEGAWAADGKAESIWDRFVRQSGRIRAGQRGDVAADHYRRWRDDIGLMVRLGLTAYRFSIAWPRVLPSGRGPVNEAGMAFYERLVDDLLRAGIDPWVTLYHWDLPAELEDAGGWPARATGSALAEFADVMSRRLGDRVDHWLTVNEPWEIGWLGYGEGVHAPGRASRREALQAIHVVLLGHGLAVQAIRANRPAVDVGLAVDMVSCYPDRNTDADKAAARRMDGYFNRWFLDPLLRGSYPADLWALFGPDVPDIRAGDLELISKPVDIVGLNYYYSAWVRDAPRTVPLRARVAPPHTVDRTALGWAVHESGLEDALGRLAGEYSVPRIAITESGAAYRDKPGPDRRVLDTARAEYHERYLGTTLRAIRNGAPVEGYFVWSLLDNFEWQLGYRPRFGLVRVDYRTQARTIKASGDWYSGVARSNELLPVNTSGTRR
jgi:beta-glucosidase